MVMGIDKKPAVRRKRKRKKGEVTRIEFLEIFKDDIPKK